MPTEPTENSTLAELQKRAGEYLILNPSALQILLQLEKTALSLHQTVLASANSCGCITLGTARPEPPITDWRELKDRDTGDEMHNICTTCRARIFEQLGTLLFYAAALANTLEADLDTITRQEVSRLDLLGYFMLM